MTIAESMLAELSQEVPGTRAMIERLPEGKFDWKPHEKSMPLGRLVSHIVELLAWVVPTVKQDELVLDLEHYEPPKQASPAAAVDALQKNLADAQSALAGVTDEHLSHIWYLKGGDTLLVEMPRVAVLRSMILNHMIHHRGQLSVYMRMLDVPLPATYGPSADEQPGGQEG